MLRGGAFIKQTNNSLHAADKLTTAHFTVAATAIIPMLRVGRQLQTSNALTAASPNATATAPVETPKTSQLGFTPCQPAPTVSHGMDWKIQEPSASGAPASAAPPADTTAAASPAGGDAGR